MLESLGLNIKYLETFADNIENPKSIQLQHNKFLIFTRENHNGTVFTGAGNLTGAAFYKNFENFQVIHYYKNQEYKYHYDAYDKKDPQKYNEYCKERGNRLATVLCYLNHVKKGGGTGFDNLKGRSEPLIIQPVKGRMVVFQNVHDDGSLHEESRHAGLPVEEGEKWGFNLWIREKPIK